MKKWAPLEVDIYRELFDAGKAGNHDIYVVFIERGRSYSVPTANWASSCPHKFFNSKYGKPVRAMIAKGKHLSPVVHFGDQQVFDGADNLHMSPIPGQVAGGAMPVCQGR